MSSAQWIKFLTSSRHKLYFSCKKCKKLPTCGFENFWKNLGKIPFCDFYIRAKIKNNGSHWGIPYSVGKWRCLKVCYIKEAREMCTHDNVSLKILSKKFPSAVGTMYWPECSICPGLQSTPPGTEPNSRVLSHVRCPVKKLQSHQLWTLDIGHWTPDIGHWTLNTGHWTPDIGHCTLDQTRRLA